MQQKTKHVIFAEQVENISFNTEVTVDLRGVIQVLTKVKNNNKVSKKKVFVNVKMMNNGYVIHSIKVDPLYLYGSMTSAFIPGKRSFISKKLFSSMSFEDIDVDDPSKIDKLMKEKDKEIAQVATELRKMKIISEIGSMELEHLAQKLQNLKQERTKMYGELEFIGKFDAFQIVVQHVVE